MKTLAFFNNKGGVGKTTLLYHLAWMFSEMGKKVLVADLDPQANLTSMFLPESELEILWDPDEKEHLSIISALEPIIRGLGDIKPAPLVRLSEGLHLIPGDLALSNFESNLSDAWGKCLDKQEPAFRATSSFYRIIQNAAADLSADLTLIDVGPNFGAINRAALISSDAVVVPLAPDLFSIQGLRNLGPKLRDWREEWEDRKQRNPAADLSLPPGTMQPLGYVILQFGIRDSRPVKAYEKWADRIPSTFTKEVLNLKPETNLFPFSQRYCLGQLKHYRSLIPLAMEARKPIFHLKPSDGAIGAHTYAVKDSEEDFQSLANEILEKLETTGSPETVAAF